MKLFVMPAKAGVHARLLALCLIWIPACAGMTALTACAHRVDLKTPTQLATAQKKAEAKKAKEAAKKANRKDESSQEVTVPEDIK